MNEFVKYSYVNLLCRCNVIYITTFDILEGNYYHWTNNTKYMSDWFNEFRKFIERYKVENDRQKT